MTRDRAHINLVDNPDFWDQKYLNNEARWDLGSPTPIFKHWVKSLNSKKSICVLGAGNGWDALYFAKLGHNVTAVDFSKEAVKNMKKKSLKSNISINIILENIFNLNKLFLNSFDFVIEYTCFCAINPNRRIEYVDLTNQILKPNGKLIALLFPIVNINIEPGPPFYVDLDKTEKLFSKHFKILKKEIPKNSISQRYDNEIFIIMKKNENYNKN